MLPDNKQYSQASYSVVARHRYGTVYRRRGDRAITRVFIRLRRAARRPYRSFAHTEDVNVAIPKSIKVAREKGYHTDRIGKCGDGKQFMGFVVAAIPSPLPRNRRALERWYAVLHTFDKKGKHLNTEAWFAGTSTGGDREAIDKAQARLDKMIAALGKVKYGDVKVGLFKVEIDGHTFGLVDASEPDEDYERVQLLPNDLVFFEPWDGSYDT
jgi:formate hydrogenlyase regulatory protein HycA